MTIRLYGKMATNVRRVVIAPMIQHESLHHVSLIVTDLERARAFYTGILGLREMERPPFDFPGIWYSVGNTDQQLHLIVHGGETKRTGRIDTRDGHFAIRVSNYEQTLEWLRKQNVEHTANPDSITGFTQIFLMDPDHNVIECNSVRSF
jgi:glyoxylase I family protein